MPSIERHPILADTSALIAVANTALWPEVRRHLAISTTNVCRQELERHRRTASEHAPDGSRESQLHHGAVAVLGALDDDSLAFTTATCVPRPHGEDAGEESLRIELLQQPDAYEISVVMDARGRDSIRRSLEREGIDVPVVAPTFLLYLLLENDLVSLEAFCLACAEMLENEGWTGYRAVKIAWESIPVDCRDFVDTRLLP